MSDSVPTPANQADPILAEHAAEIRRLHNRLSYIARRIQAGHERAIKGSAEWVEGSLELAIALREGREAVPADISYKDWLKAEKLDFYNSADRAALINLASDPALARTVLSESKSISYQLIWREHKGRFYTNIKPAPVDKRGRPVARNRNRAMIYRRMKLGDATIDKLKDTSLASAREQDALVFLNRGAAEGEHTPIVDQLVADAVAGKSASAVAVKKNGAPPPRDNADDIGVNSAGEIVRKDDELEVLRAAERMGETQDVGLHSHIEGLGRKPMTLPRRSKSPDPAAVREAAWNAAVLLNDLGPDSPGEIARKLARLEELETENVGLRSEVENLRSENARLREALDEASKKFTKPSGESAALRDQPAPAAADGLDIPGSLRRAAPAPATERGSG